MNDPEEGMTSLGDDPYKHRDDILVYEVAISHSFPRMSSQA